MKNFYTVPCPDISPPGACNKSMNNAKCTQSLTQSFTPLSHGGGVHT